MESHTNMQSQPGTDGNISYGWGWQTTACGPSTSPTVFVNKVLLEHSHAHSSTCCPWPLYCYNAELRSYNRQCMARRA